LQKKPLTSLDLIWSHNSIGTATTTTGTSYTRPRSKTPLHRE
jgi:hypothetical protein